MTVIRSYRDFCDETRFKYKDYQHAGVSFCKNVEANTRWRGGLIADDMGLGKTIMMLGLITCNFKPRTLIVLPLALLHQWQNTIYEHLGHKPLVFHGQAAKRCTKQQLAEAPIVLTTYGKLASPVPRKGKLPPPPRPCILKDIAWSRVIFDEGHHLRNASTGRHQGALDIKAECRWVVTGTPIQNRKSDFYALCAQMGFSRAFYSNPDNLKIIAKSHILRRTKSEVGIKLPALKEHKHKLQWADEEERDVAEQIHALVFAGNERPERTSQAVHGFGMQKLPLMVRARQMCVYPPLILPKLREILEGEDQPQNDTNKRLVLGASKHSKIDAAVRAIAGRKNKRAKLLFCSYRGEIDVLQERLAAEGLSVSVLDGRVSLKARQNTLADKTIDVLILQTQTGCEGLNLQRFSEVYFITPQWNPTIEDQAVARAHRIGQTEEVDVFRFTMADFSHGSITVEKRVIETQNTKRELAREITEIEQQPTSTLAQ